MHYLLVEKVQKFPQDLPDVNWYHMQDISSVKKVVCYAGIDLDRTNFLYAVVKFTFLPVAVFHIGRDI